MNILVNALSGHFIRQGSVLPMSTRAVNLVKNAAFQVLGCVVFDGDSHARRSWEVLFDFASMH